MTTDGCDQDDRRCSSPALLGLSLAILIVAVTVMAWGLFSSPPSVPGPTPSPTVEVKPEQVLYVEDPVAAIATGFTDPQGLAVAEDGTVIICGEHGARAFGKNGNMSWQTVTKHPLRVVIPCGRGFLGIAKDGWLGVGPGISDGETTGFTKSEIDGEIVSSVRVDLVTYYSVVEAHPKTHVWRLDSAPSGPARYVPQRMTTFANPPLKSSTVHPRPFLGLAWSPSENLLVVANLGEHRIQKFRPDGTQESSWGFPSFTDPAGFTGCCNPIAIAVDGQGRVFTSEKGQDFARVKRYDRQGRWQGYVAPPVAFKNAKFGAVALAVDHLGRVLVLDAETRQVRVFVEKSGKEGV